MSPANARIAEPPATVVIPPHSLFDGEGGSGPAPTRPGGVAPGPVHGGHPQDHHRPPGPAHESAQNVTVSFRDYIANVASSEVYPTWPEAALRANIHCQISLVLNRIYTEWYPSRGYPFNISGSPRLRPGLRPRAHRL